MCELSGVSIVRVLGKGDNYVMAGLAGDEMEMSRVADTYCGFARPK